MEAIFLTQFQFSFLTTLLLFFLLSRKDLCGSSVTFKKACKNFVIGDFFFDPPKFCRILSGHFLLFCCNYVPDFYLNATEMQQKSLCDGIANKQFDSLSISHKLFCIFSKLKLSELAHFSCFCLVLTYNWTKT